MNNTHVEPESGSDFLYGVPIIAGYLGLKDQAVYHLIAKGRLPTFKMGRRICARRSTLTAWLDEQEAKGNG